METTIKEQDNRHIVLDTCILQFIGDKNKSKSSVLQNCLDGLIEEGYTFTISEISVFEHMQGIWGSKANKAYQLLQVYKWQTITRLILLWATYLGGFYHDERIDGIAVGDKIIAATAIVANGLLLTANHKDYPHPFFTTEKAFALPYQVGHYTKTMDIILYKPNMEFLVRRLKEKEQEV